MADSEQTKPETNRPAHSANPYGRPLVTMTTHDYIYVGASRRDLPLHLGAFYVSGENVDPNAQGEVWLTYEAHRQGNYKVVMITPDDREEVVYRHAVAPIAMMVGRALIHLNAIYEMAEGLFTEASHDLEHDRDGLQRSLQGITNALSQVAHGFAEQVEEMSVAAGGRCGMTVVRLDTDADGKVTEESKRRAEEQIRAAVAGAKRDNMPA